MQFACGDQFPLESKTSARVQISKMPFEGTPLDLPLTGTFMLGVLLHSQAPPPRHRSYRGLKAMPR